LFIVATIAII